MAKSAEPRWAGMLRRVHPPPEARHVAQARPDPARARRDGARRQGRLPQGQPSPQPSRRARRHLRRRRLRRPVPQARPAGAAAVAPGAGHPAAVPREPARPASRRGGAGADRLEVPARARADRPRLRPLGPVRVPLAPARGQRRGAPAAQAAGGVPGARACSRRAAGSGPTPPTCWRPSACSTASSCWARPCARRSTSSPPWPRTGCAGWRPKPGTSATRAGSRTAACRGPRPSARPTRAPSARTGSRCSTGSTSPTTPEGLRRLPAVEVLRRVWARHFVREGGAPPGGGVRLRAKEEPPPATEPVESPYDPEARFRTRSGTSWAGYIVHLSETCEDDAVHLLTHAMTTVATVHEARCTAAIHRALAGKGLVPAEHLVDAAYVDAELLVRGREELGIDLVGPPRPNPSWQGKVEGGYTHRPVRGRLGRATGALPAGEAVLGLEPAGRPRRHAVRLGLVPQGRLCRLRGSAAVHPSHAPGPAPEAAAAGRARGAQGGARTAGAPRRGGALRAAGRDRGHHLAGRARLRAAPQPLPRAGQDPPAARGDRGRDQPRSARRLVPGGPARRHPHLALRRPRRLTRLRQRYPTV